MNDRNYLIKMYNATCTDKDGNDELETYEAWLERQLLSRLASAPEPGINLQDWISVEDRLPEDEFAYLVCIIVGSSPLPQVSRYPCYYYPESKIWLPIDSPHPMENVTHWIEFPAPPLSHLEAKEGRG